MSILIGGSELKQCLTTVLHKQQDIAVNAAGTTLSAQRLQQRLLVLERFFAALGRQAGEQQGSNGRKRLLKEETISLHKGNDKFVNKFLQYHPLIK